MAGPTASEDSSGCTVAEGVCVCFGIVKEKQASMHSSVLFGAHAMHAVQTPRASLFLLQGGVHRYQSWSTLLKKEVLLE